MSYIGAQPTSVAFQTDQFSGNGSTVAFTMSVAPASTSSMLVAITGVTQDPTTYSIVGTTLTFSAAPPTGTGNISVRYLGIPASGVTTTAYRTITNFTATAGQTTFSVPSYTVGYIDVFRNGVRLVNSGADFVATNGTTIVLNNACTVGDSVVTESFYVSSVLNAIPATAGAVNSTYITDAAVTTAKLDTASVTQAKLAANVASNGPAFSAYKSGTQTLTNNVWTKVTYTQEEYDTNSNYDAPNSKFQPAVAGYYRLTTNVDCFASASGSNLALVGFYKNGSIAKLGNGSNATGSEQYAYCSATIYLNGSTDYIEAYALYTSPNTPSISGSAVYTYFQGELVRSA